jgi:hypothetical protein
MKGRSFSKEKHIMSMIAVVLCILVFIQIIMINSNSEVRGISTIPLRPQNKGVNSYGWESLNEIITDCYADGTSIQRSPDQQYSLSDDTPGVLNGDHPFTNNITKLFDVNEFAVIEYARRGEGNGYMIDDALSSPDPFQPMETQTWGVDSPEYIIGVETGDFNADGHDEIITVDDNGEVRILEYQSGRVNQTVYDLNMLESDNHANIAVGNFNTDPGDEFVISCGSRNRLHIWDPWDDASGTYYQPGDQGDNPNPGNGFINVFHADLDNPQDIATADINGNGVPDIITVGTNCEYNVIEYDYIQSDWEKLGFWKFDLITLGWNDFSGNADPGGEKNWGMAVGIGDVDGDIKKDIAVMHTSKDFSLKLNVIYWYTYTTTGMEEIGNETAFGNLFHPSIGMGDIDSDGLSETIVTGIDLTLPYSAKWTMFIFDDKRANFKQIDHLQGIECSWVTKHFVFTDIDSDGADEIIFSTHDRNKFDTAITTKHTYVVDYNARTELFSQLAEFNGKKGFLAAGDFDNDGITCKYLGFHGKRVTPSIPLFVLTPPPAYKGINDEGSETSISTEESVATGHSDQFSVSAGITFSYGNEFKVFGQGVEWKISVGASYEFAYTKTKTTTTTYGVQYSTSHDDNYVVFHAVEYESYIYTVLSHPDASSIGSNVSIDVPLQTNIFKAPVAYYNKKNATIPIGAETFTHTIGKPGTYPTKREALYLNPTYISPQPKAVSHGNSSDSIFHTVGTEETVSYEHSVSLEFTVEFGAKIEATKYGLEFSLGIGYGHTSETTVGSAMTYEATVSDISDASFFEKYNYDWGMFIRTISRPDGSRYKLVHYYAEGEFPADDDIIGEIQDFIAENPLQVSATAVVGVVTLFAILIFIRRRR